MTTGKRLQRPGRKALLALPRYDLAADAAFALKPIGVVRSPFVWREQAPRQATVGEPQQATIVLRPGLQNTLKDLEGFDRAWVLFWFHHSRGWKQQIVPPRDRVKRGIFATRAPDRPNALGLSAVGIVAIYGTRITISGHDLLDGTPVLDLKPYIPAYDSFPGARAGWVDTLSEPGPDHRVREGKLP
jgi:tRNA-Thr(GGU) m(6)t(6)A37 methyltransferase TsaA